MACTLTESICQASAARDPRPAHARPHDAAFPKAEDRRNGIFGKDLARLVKK